MDDARRLTHAKPFPGPNTALLWLLARRTWPKLSIVAGFTLFLGTQHARDNLDPGGTQEPVAMYVMDVVIIFVILFTSPRDHTSLLGCWRPTHQALPVSHQRLRRLDLAYFSAWAAICGTAYIAGFWLVAPLDPLRPGAPAIFLAYALGLIAFPALQAIRRAFEFHIHVTLSMLVFAVMIGLCGIFIFDAAVIPAYAIPPAFLAIAALSNAGLRWAAPQAWRPEETAPDAPARAPESTVASPDDDDSPIPSPFPHRGAANDWFAVRRLDTMAINPGIWITVFGWTLLLYFLSRAVADTPGFLYTDLMGILGVTYLYALPYWDPGAMLSALPVSPWTQTRHHMRLITVALAALTGAGWLLLAASHFRFGTDWWPMALWIPWTAWAGVALLPAAVLSIGVYAAFEPGTAPFASAMAFVYVGYIAVVATAHDFREQTAARRDLLRLVLPLIAGGAGLVLLQALALGPIAHAVLRELVGAGIVLALLRYNLATHRIPQAAACRLTVALAAVLLLMVIAFALTGAPDRPGGIIPLFTGIGWTAALFLPFLLLPHAITSAHVRPKRNKENQWSTPWMT